MLFLVVIALLQFLNCFVNVIVMLSRAFPSNVRGEKFRQQREY